MYFKKLELIGFKSFCEKTTLHFEPGITAVVGPNGCGKSNVFDSIRWVLGEQSAKSLRGSDMQDVIFNGTDKKESLGMAEVTLTFDNEKRFFNFDHPELAITRRIFRSGESEYLLNKTVVRLKDILDILLGTGIGAESYSIVAQGKIDLVLSSKPEERRLVFDEAAGITKYKAQKRETTRRLEETEQNLLRVNDIVTEVKRQIGSLERQAQKARRYKEAFGELKTKEIDLGLFEKRQIFKQRDELILQLRELESKESGLLNLIKEQEEGILGRKLELKAQEDTIAELKSGISNLENLIIRNQERTTFDKEKIIELTKDSDFLKAQIEQVKSNIILDEQKLNNIKTEYETVKKEIEEKSRLLQDKEIEIANLSSSVKHSLDAIVKAKQQILSLVTKIVNARNEISDFNAKQQIYLARNKRLEIENAKASEERIITEGSLNSVTGELRELNNSKESQGQKISANKKESEQESLSLAAVEQEILKLEREKLTLESHKEFLEKLKTKYEDIGECMNAVIQLDRPPKEKLSGLVIKVREHIDLSTQLSGEAKPIELDTGKILQFLKKLEEDLTILKDNKAKKEGRIGELNLAIQLQEEELHDIQIGIANKESSQKTILEQFNKIKEEEELICLELQDVKKELAVLEDNLKVSQDRLEELNKEHRLAQDLIAQEEEKIALNNKLREDTLVLITQTKTELEGLSRRQVSEQSTLNILEATYKQDRESAANLARQFEDNSAKKDSLEKEVLELENKIKESASEIEEKNQLLKQGQDRFRDSSDGVSEVISRIDSEKEELDEIKNKLYELQMQNKDIDYKYASLKDRLMQAYKVDLDSITDLLKDFDKTALQAEIEKLKEKLDSYGTVNLVAIEEYDELKKRYDFLIQQQNDLTQAKDSLHEAILKINRTTKQMFLETFEKVREEFRNYFKLLFNGGDAQVFLIDEQDPLESGIEIVCRPPGRKLQNVLLLSGGEKSMSAIALIFAIFKVKPSPFCILDEIDAALDEANVDRFSRALQEFSNQSQFIVITHNKRTIANANVMYGITMQESGVSKIVSVKFAKGASRELKDRDPGVAVSEAA